MLLLSITWLIFTTFPPGCPPDRPSVHTHTHTHTHTFPLTHMPRQDVHFPSISLSLPPARHRSSVCLHNQISSYSLMHQMRSCLHPPARLRPPSCQHVPYNTIIPPTLPPHVTSTHLLVFVMHSYLWCTRARSVLLCVMWPWCARGVLGLVGSVIVCSCVCVEGYTHTAHCTVLYFMLKRMFQWLQYRLPNFSGVRGVLVLVGSVFVCLLRDVK